MGHTRLGTLPKTRRWSSVIGLLGAGAELPSLAGAVVHAAEAGYRDASDNRAIEESIRLMALLASSARSQNFIEALAAQGLSVPDDTDALRFLRDVFVEADRRFGANAEKSIFSEFAAMAFREALTETVSSQTGTLFTAGVGDVQEAYRQFGTERGFARLSRLFFARLLAHSLQYFTDKRVASELGTDSAIASESDLLELNRAIKSYAFEASKIVEEFAGAWYSKSLWLRREPNARRFTAIAMEKIASELATAQ